MRALSKGETLHYEWRKWVQLLTIAIERLNCGIVTIMDASIPILFPVRSWHEHFFTPVYILMNEKSTR